MTDVDPLAWLADMLARLQGHPAKRFDELLPWTLPPSHAAARRGMNSQ